MQKHLEISIIKYNINQKRDELNRRVLDGVDSEVITLSQELDELITIYTKYQIESIKK